MCMPSRSLCEISRLDTTHPKREGHIATKEGRRHHRKHPAGDIRLRAIHRITATIMRRSASTSDAPRQPVKNALGMMNIRLDGRLQSPGRSPRELLRKAMASGLRNIGTGKGNSDTRLNMVIHHKGQPRDFMTADAVSTNSAAESR